MYVSITKKLHLSYYKLVINFYLPVEEVKKMPSWHLTSIPPAHICNIVFTKELHSHDSEDKNDDTKDKDEVGQGRYCFSHYCQNVIE